MKNFFFIILGILVLASALRYWSLPDSKSSVPIIYWGTDANPVRQEQVNRFHQWLRNQGHVVRDSGGNPKLDPQGQFQTICELRLDAVNRDPAKKTILGLSGVGDDIMDIYSSRELIYYTDMGILSDVTEAGKQLGFDPSKTFPSVVSQITRDGRQYSFPCNVAFTMLWVNMETFEKHGQAVPPKSWTVREFEQRGKELVAAANSPDQHQRVFFVNQAELYGLYRSLGVTTYNETLTASHLNDPRVVETLEQVYKWTHIDRMIPSMADRQSISTTSNGYGDVDLQMFANNIVALMHSGRYALIQFREFNQTRRHRGQGPMKLKVVGQPYYQFPNVLAGVRAAAIYQKSNHKDYAELFLAYLASEDYNMQILRDGDSLPPNPSYCLMEEYNRPSDHPEEWGVHEPFYQVSAIAIGEDHSPYVVPNVCLRIVSDAFGDYWHNRVTAKQAAKQAAIRLNQEISQTLKDNPQLQSEYNELVILQRKIDQRRKDRQPIPRSWIKNPFYQRYYQAMGWIETE